MLAETYIEALLVNEELADQVWQLWNDDVIDDEQAKSCSREIAAQSYLRPRMLRISAKYLGTI